MDLDDYELLTTKIINGTTDRKAIVDYIINLRKEIEMKDKIIYSMAEFISCLDIEEDICNNSGKDLNECDSMNFGECEHCIMEYFINKVKEGK